MITDENIIIKNILDGNANEFAFFINKYQLMAYNCAFKIVKNNEDAEEIVQDSFLKAYNKLFKFDFQKKFSTWLYTIVYNTSISKVRIKSVIQYDIEEISESKLNNIKTELVLLEAKEKKQYINEAIDNLNEIDALIISLYYLEEQSLSEISEITNMKTNTVKVKLHRAREKMYSELYKILKNEVRDLL